MEGSAALSLIQKFTVDGQSCVLSYVSSARREMVLLENELHQHDNRHSQKLKCSYSACLFFVFFTLSFGRFLVNLLMITSPFLQMGADSMLIFLSYLFQSCSVFCVG